MIIAGARRRSGAHEGNGFRLTDQGGGDYRVEGDLSFATVADASKAMERLFTQGGRFRFDLAGVGRADSAGVALLLEWLRQARDANAALHYVHLPEPLRAIARVSGVEALLMSGQDPLGS
jgi:phospholipid transport system transporter-binding protein